MADRLKEIKNMVEAMDGNFTAKIFGIEMNEKTLVEDYKWLVERAEVYNQIETILLCGDLEDDEKFNNINALFFDE